MLVTPGGAVFVGVSMRDRVPVLEAATWKEIRSGIVAAPAWSNPAASADDVAWAAGGSPILRARVADRIAADRLEG